MKFENRAFTLIELLVVISIVALLSSVVMSSLNTARTKARDAQRRSDLHQIELAMQAYFADNGRFPDEDVCDSSKGVTSAQSCSDTVPTGTNWSPSSSIYTALVPNYIKILPVDPVNSGAYYYNYEPNNINQGRCVGAIGPCEYTLWANLETGGDFCVGSAQPPTITCTP